VSGHSQFQLLRERRFAPLFWTQFLGAANDNLFKFAFTLLATYHAAEWGGLDASSVGFVIGAIFITPFVLLSAENVGPQVGADLQKKAVLAIVWSTIGMLLYIVFRFRSLPFGVGAVVAIVHDTLITIGLLALFGREFNLIVVAALLTLVGYSNNDTVVVLDRVRENLKTPKKEPLDVVINRSINQTLSRTILTSGATLIVVIALYFLGGEVLNTFALTLIIGIIVGTYSSIYVAASIVVIWKNFQNRRKLAVVPAPAPVKAPAVPPTAPTPSASASSAAVARPAGSGKKKKNRR